MTTPIREWQRRRILTVFKGDFMVKFNRDTIKDKIHACWIGKNIGGTMGAPYEGKREFLDIKGTRKKIPIFIGLIAYIFMCLILFRATNLTQYLTLPTPLFLN